MRAALTIPLIALLLALACQSEPEVVYIVLTPTPVAPTVDVATATPSPTSTPAPAPTPTAVPTPTPAHSQALHRVDATPEPPRYEYTVNPDRPGSHLLSEPLAELLETCEYPPGEDGTRGFPVHVASTMTAYDMKLHFVLNLRHGMELADIVHGDPLACRYPG